MPRPLAGRRVIVTREEPGALAAMLAERGAEMVHHPAIRRVDPADGGEELGRYLDRLDRFDWLVLTSPEGARRVGPAVRDATVRVAVVGAATAEALEEVSGRTADLVPDEQRAAALAGALADVGPGGGRSVLLAQADRATDTLAEALRDAGFEVSVVVAYRTVIVPPDPSVVDADAVLFASGSAVRAWVEGCGVATPPVAVAIGPSTAAVASELGVALSAVASEHSLEGLVAALESAVR